MNATPVRVAWLGPDDVGAALLAEAEAWATAAERARLQRIARCDDQLNFLRGRWLMRRLLADATDTPGAAWSFVTGDHGRPEPVGPVAAPSVNISHTRRLVVAALSADAPVGVDVEYADRQPPAGVARRFFASEEVDALERLEPTARQQRFWRVWTLKEAWLKAAGTGISGSLDSVVVQFRDPEPPRLGTADPGALAELSGPAGARIAVCALGTDRITCAVRQAAAPGP